MGYGVLFHDRQFFILSEGASTLDATMRLGIKEGTLYRLIGLTFSWFLKDLELGSYFERENESLLYRSTWYDMILMDEEHI